ncbi:hypothetical protein E2C01_022689 [Portunus trituberculatus]|uniref:Uncharacterized protein n=1 Tax=Portunus trituberculatus TaxID=210409 RepID=A0A5B7E8A5_PORTR|nr:hypothetical protein [Portunus trituberculatus]
MQGWERPQEDHCGSRAGPVLPQASPPPHLLSFLSRFSSPSFVLLAWPRGSPSAGVLVLQEADVLTSAEG